VFQAREGSPELNCCSVNGPRGLGMLSEWAVMLNTDGIALNYYGPGIFRLTLPSGNPIELTQATRYPTDGQIEIKLHLMKKERLNLQLRIPAWSEDTRVAVNGEEMAGILSGRYLSLEREWQNGDEVRLWLDMSPHVWIGEREACNKASVYLGPLLMVYDRQINDLDPLAVAVISPLNLRHMSVLVSETEGDSGPWVRASVPCEGDKDLFLCDFASAGQAGTPYRSWLPVSGLSPQPFSREHPVWCASLEGIN
jgi:uncharacterized protein